jgi:hypothetical protein
MQKRVMEVLAVWMAMVVMVATAAPSKAQQKTEGGSGAGTATIGEKTAGTEKKAGYFNLYWDAKQGKLWLEIDKWGTEFLYQSGLPAGIGSNDIGLDRGQLGETRIVRFERSGPKVLLLQENLEYRAVSNDADERRAVHEKKKTACWWTQRISSCATRTAFRRRCGGQSKGHFMWTFRGARFTCR